MKLALPFRSLLSALVVTGFSMNTAAFAASDDSAKRLEGVEEQLEQVILPSFVSEHFPLPD